MFYEVVGGKKLLLAQKSKIRVRIFFSSRIPSRTQGSSSSLKVSLEAVCFPHTCKLFHFLTNRLFSDEIYLTEKISNRQLLKHSKENMLKVQQHEMGMGQGGFNNNCTYLSCSLMCSSLAHPFRRAPEDNKSSDAGQYFTLESQHNFLRLSALDNLSWGYKWSIFKELKNPWALLPSSGWSPNYEKQKKVPEIEPLTETLYCSWTLPPTDCKASSTHLYSSTVQICPVLHSWNPGLKEESHWTEQCTIPRKNEVPV